VHFSEICMRMLAFHVRSFVCVCVCVCARARVCVCVRACGPSGVMYSLPVHDVVSTALQVNSWKVHFLLSVGSTVC
jgi:hypothetical protein